MSQISLDEANVLLKNHFNNFCKEIEPSLKRMVNNANIDSYYFTNVEVDDGPLTYVHLNLGEHCNGVPGFDNYNSLEDLNSVTTESFIEVFGEFSNFFPGIWIYPDKIGIEFYFFEEDEDDN